jgi:hypothetical protein
MPHSPVNAVSSFRIILAWPADRALLALCLRDLPRIVKKLAEKAAIFKKEVGLLVAPDIDYHDRDVVGLRLRVAISGPRKYLLKQTPGKLLGGKALMCVEEIAQPGCGIRGKANGIPG